MSATFHGQKYVEMLQDKHGLGIDEVEIITDQSKAEIIKKFRDIKEKAEESIKESKCRLGIFFICIGFMIWEEDHSDLLTELEAPLEDKSLAHHYPLTTEGEAVNMN